MFSLGLKTLCPMIFLTSRRAAALEYTDPEERWPEAVNRHFLFLFHWASAVLLTPEVTPNRRLPLLHFTPRMGWESLSDILERLCQDFCTNVKFAQQERERERVEPSRDGSARGACCFMKLSWLLIPTNVQRWSLTPLSGVTQNHCEQRERRSLSGRRHQIFIGPHLHPRSGGDSGACAS